MIKNYDDKIMMTKQDVFKNQDVFRKIINKKRLSAIPPCDRSYLLHEVGKLPEGATIVEIGTFVAGTTKCMAEVRPDCKIFSLDINTWNPDDALLNYCKEHWELAEIDDEIIHLAQKINIDKFVNVTLITSRALDFKIDNIDLLYIDGDHNFEPVLSELRYYWDKMSCNGIIMGDDVNSNDTYDAVKVFAFEENLEIMIYNKSFKIFKQVKGYLEPHRETSRSHNLQMFGPQDKLNRL